MLWSQVSPVFFQNTASKGLSPTHCVYLFGCRSVCDIFRCSDASSKDCTCSAEVRIRTASAMLAVARLNRIWRCNTISFSSKFKLYKSLVTSVLLCGCETWTLLADSDKRSQALETKSRKKPLRILYLDHKTNDWAQSKINVLVGPQEPHLATVKRRKFAWLFGHVARHDSLSRTTLQGTLEV